MTDSFMQNHQSALDSQREDNAIQDLEDAGIYPVPDNDAVLENLFEDAKESLIEKGMHLIFSNEEIEECAFKIAKSKFDELPEPGDYDD
jgi:hypothetical protein